MGEYSIVAVDKLCFELDLGPTIPNIKLVTVIFIYYNIFKFRVRRAVSFRVIVQVLVSFFFIQGFLTVGYSGLFKTYFSVWEFNLLDLPLIRSYLAKPVKKF